MWRERATTIVVFAEDGDTEVLGVYALEGLGLEVDP
jgi:predicted aspartyl protease